MNPRGSFLVGAVAFDGPGSRKARVMGKVLGASLLRSIFNGEIVILRNFAQPLFPVERVGLEEVEVNPRGELSYDKKVKEEAIDWRFTMASQLASAPAREWVILSDLDVVPLRNWDHLFERSDVDLLVHRDPEGNPDPGFFAVRGERIGEFALAWKAATEQMVTSKTLRKDQAALEYVLKTGGWRAGDFERGEVVRPFDAGADLKHCLAAAVVHLAGGTPEEKVKMSFALHMMWVYGEDDGVFLDLLES